MRKAVLLVCLVSACLVFSASASRASGYRIVSSERESITVEFTAAEPVIIPMIPQEEGTFAVVYVSGFSPERIEGKPVLPVKRYFFEVPAKLGTRLQVIDLDAEPIEGVLPEVWFGGENRPDEAKLALSRPEASAGRDFAVLAGVCTFRKREIAFVDIYPVVYDAGSARLVYARKITVRLSFRRDGAPDLFTAGAAARLPEDALILNSEQALSWRPSGAAEPRAMQGQFEFGYSDNWIKMKVASSGMYTVTYNDLLSAGIDPLAVDPSKIRIFSSGPLQQPDDLDNGGSFLSDFHMTEHPLIYNGAGSGSFLAGESIVFYCLGPDGWADCIDASAERIAWCEHDYADENIYWLTWGDGIPGEPARMGQRDVSLSGGAPDTTITRHEERIHAERDNLYAPKHTDDNWYWNLMSTGSTTFVDNFYISAVAGGTGRVRALGYGPYNSNIKNHVDCYINGNYVGALEWINLTYYFAPDTLDAAVTGLHNGLNEFRLVKGISDKMYVMGYDLFYDRYLTASSGALDFFVRDAAGAVRFAMNGFTMGDVILIDATDYEVPVLLTGWQPSGGAIDFEDALAGFPAHYVAYSKSVLKKPVLEVVSISPGDLVSLRDEQECPEMLIIYNGLFENAAEAIRDYRAQAMSVKAVDIDAVYDNFSNGMKDPVAVRNYIKFLYDNFTVGGDPELRHVLLIGNGIYDPKNILGTGIDYIPLYMKDYIREVVEDDDFFVTLDEGNDLMPDIAVGRMTVLTAAEASGWARRIIDYESYSDPGSWRNKIIMIADDQFSTHTSCDYSFLFDMENMTIGQNYFPEFVDYKKIFLIGYPFMGDVKPSATADLLEEWNEGALVVNYMGHGSPQQIADESVMQKSDVYSLNNGGRLPLFLAFSCSVGNFESPYQRSMGQELVVREGGGAIAVIAGSGGTLGPPNTELCYSIFENIFTSGDSTGTLPLGTAVLLAKPCCADLGSGMNNSQYVLFGDPAMSLAVPTYKIDFDVASVDTMITGLRYTLGGTVRAGGSVLESFNGTADIVVQDSRMDLGGDTLACFSDSVLHYFIPGKGIFRGTVDVSSGRFAADFVVPVRSRTGGKARIRGYASSSGSDAVGSAERLTIIGNPSPPENDEAPDIDIYFAGQATKVKQGAMLVVEISDPDGVAIAGSDPQSSIFLEFDKSGYPIFVTEYFKYDHGSSSTGSVEYPLHAGFSSGKHEVTVRAFDNLGLSSTDTLSFEVVEEGLFTVSDVFNMPNPFSESTNFIFQLSSEADVTLKIYNVSGREVWRREMFAAEGFNSIYWTGRDFAEDRLANGTYLYMLDVSFRNSFNRKESVKGKVVLLR